MKWHCTMQRIWTITFLFVTQDCGTCYGKEKPLFTFPNYANESVRQDFCGVKGLVEEGKIKRRDALRGIDLHVALFSYQLNKETGAIDEVNPGAALLFLDELARRAGFQWRNSYGVIDPPKGNETWSDLLLWSSSTYDLVGDWFLLNEDRVESGIIYSESWTDTSMIMVIKNDAKEDTAFLNFLRPFTSGLWGLLGLTIVVTGVVYYVLDNMYARSKGSNREKIQEFGFRESMFNAAWLFTGHTLHAPRSFSTSLLVFSASFLCLLIVAAYTANLVSFLLPMTTDRIMINDISDAIRNDLSFCIVSSSSYYDFMKKNYPMARLVTVEETSMGYGQQTYHALEKSECDIVLTSIDTFEKRKRSLEYNANCDLKWIGQIVDEQKGIFPIMDSSQACTVVVSEVITLHLLEMKRDKTFHNIWENFYARSESISCKAKIKKHGTQRIEVANVFGIFVIYYAMLFIAILWSTLRLYFSPNKLMSDVKTSLRNSLTSGAALNQELNMMAQAPSHFGANYDQESLQIDSTASAPSNVFKHFKQETPLSDDLKIEQLEENMNIQFHQLAKSMNVYFENFEENINQKLEGLQNKANDIEKKEV